VQTGRQCAGRYMDAMPERLQQQQTWMAMALERKVGEQQEAAEKVWVVPCDYAFALPPLLLCHLSLRYTVDGSTWLLSKCSQNLQFMCRLRKLEGGCCWVLRTWCRVAVVFPFLHGH
jgi:hypothetical protein